MADSAIRDLTAQDAVPVSSLPAAMQIFDNSLFVFEHDNVAYKVTGAQLKFYAIAAAQSVQKGADGITPHVGANGNWWLGDLDTGVHAEAEDGTDGVGIKSITQTVVATEDGGENVITFTLTNEQTFDIKVKNGSQGPSGSGTGDMVARTYDPQGKKQDIFAYVDNKLEELPASSGGDLLVTVTLAIVESKFTFLSPSHSFAEIWAAAAAGKNVRLQLSYAQEGADGFALYCMHFASQTVIAFVSTFPSDDGGVISTVGVDFNDAWTYEAVQI